MRYLLFPVTVLINIYTKIFHLFPSRFGFNGTSVSFFDDLNKTTSVLLTFKQILFALIC